MKKTMVAVYLACVSFSMVSLVHGEDAASIAGIVESLRAKASAMESSIRDMEQQLAAGREISARIDAEARSAGASEKKEYSDAKAIEAAAKELARMEKTVADLAKRAAGLKTQVEAVEALRADLDKAVELRTQAEKEASAAAAARQKAESDLAGMRGKIAAVEKEVSDMDAVVRSGRRLESDLAKAIDERKKADADAEKSLADAKSVADEIAAANAALADSQTRLADAKKQVAALNAMRAELEKEQKLILDHQAASKRTQSETASLQKELLSRQREKADLDKELAGLQDAIRKNEQDPVHAELEKTRALRVEAEKLAAGFADARSQAGLELDALKKELDEARRSVSEKEAQLKAGRRVVSDLANEKKAREAALDKAEKEAKAVESLEREMLGLKTEIAQHEAKLADGAKQMEELGVLQKQLEEERKLKDASEARVKSALSAQSTMGKELARLRSEHDAAQKEFDKIDGRRKMLDQLRAELKETAELKAMSDARASEAEAARVEAEKNLTKIKAELSLQQKKNEEMSRAVRDARGLESEVAREKDLKAASEARLKKESEAAVALEKEIAEIGKRIEAAVGEGTDGAKAIEAATRLRGEIEAQKKAKGESEQAIRELRETVSRMEKQRSSLLKDIAAAEKDVASKQAEAVKLEAELAKEKKANEALAAQLSEGQAAIDAVAAEITASEKKFGELQAALSEKSGKLYEASGLRDSIKEQQRLAADSEKKLAGINSERKNLDGRMAALGKALSGVESSLAKAEGELEEAGRLAAELEKAKAARAEAEARTGAGERARDALETALKDLEDKAKVLGETAGRLEDRQKSIAATASASKASAPAASKPSGDSDIIAVEKQILESARSGDKQSAGEPADRAKAVAEANASYQRGIAKWDDGDIDGAIADFSETIRLNPEAAGAYFNLGLAYLRKGDAKRACDYAYKAGECYLKHGNEKQAMRMVLFMKQVDPSSPLIEKLRRSIP